MNKLQKCSSYFILGKHYVFTTDSFVWMDTERLRTQTMNAALATKQRLQRFLGEIRQWLADIENPGLLVRMSLVIGVLSIVYLFVLAMINSITFALVPTDFPARGAVAMLLAIGITVAFTGVQYLFGKRTALESVDATELRAADAPELHATVGALSEEMGIEKPALYTADLGAPNAFAIGRQSDGTVVLGTELLAALDDEEIEGVVAHELAHLKHRDSVLLTFVASVRKLSIIIATIVTTLTVMATAMLVEAIASNSGNDNRGTNTNWSGVTAVCVSVIGTIIALCILLFSNALSRYREYIADTTAARALGDTAGLESALESIERYHETADTGQSEVVSALCIFGDREGIIANLFATHPSMDARIENLRSLEEPTHDARSDA